ncbi:FAD-binding oxidoreductase [Paracoccus yeei]|uniref:D-lactate dehydrogenase (cytochrome) n=1 Tax=Paracoccus yeei TaxID=147645 RepID=A0A0D5A1S2_9RHOB|nr:FAD-linked oxidase C-terminal domain-containing protein [Paracoccus yeei]AJW30101.1 D-lactate dehydrogenase [Paracoccus yeei]OWJ89975.1 FAD-binding oxidoreductase [Paracoccus yeei]PZT92437.1 MAG: FAD-binding oxidoreductase [Citromicrobium sp.]
MTSTTPATSAALAALAPCFGDRLLTSAAVRDQHGAAESWLPAAAPDAVVMAQSTEEVARVLAVCHNHGVPVIPFGAGSSIEGQVLAPKGGISLDVSGMDRILAIHAEDMDCVVQCGVTRQRLNEELRATGLFFPVDLGAQATLGGMASTRASGTTTVRYGSMRELVLGLTVVLPDGQVIRTGGRARKSAAGYDLTHLFVGAEGTLGVITELTLRLFGKPEAAQSLLCSFPDLDAATACVVAAQQCSLGLTRIELADDLQMAAINSWCAAALPETATLWVEITGSGPSVAHDVALFQDLASDAGATRIEPAATAEDATRLWRIRHEALYATRALRPGIKGISTDVCVPLSRLPDCIAAIKTEIAATGFVAPLIGHVGDGNFHLVLLFDPADPQETETARAINRRLVELALSMGGTSTGEHGVGLGKKAYMEAEHGPALDLMRRLKRAVDPRGIMNPGKIFDL